jgi:hypothetical protein
MLDKTIDRVYNSLGLSLDISQRGAGVLMELFLSIFLGISGILVLYLLNPGREAAWTEVTCFVIIHLGILSIIAP